MAAVPLPLSSAHIKVSSVLNGDAVYGKANLFDGKEVTCWNSDQGLPQWIVVQFQEAMEVQEVEFVFQGGFVGKVVEVLPLSGAKGKGEDGSEGDGGVSLFPLDVNRPQRFPLDFGGPVGGVRVVFRESTDFFGRVTLYHLRLFGIPPAPPDLDDGNGASEDDDDDDDDDDVDSLLYGDDAVV